jgi:hypothetical protein
MVTPVANPPPPMPPPSRLEDRLAYTDRPPAVSRDRGVHGSTSINDVGNIGDDAARWASRRS